MSEDNSVMEGKLDNIIVLLTSMNRKLGELLAYIGAREIQEQLKKEDKDEKSDEVLRQHSVGTQQIKAEERFDSVPDSKALPVVAEIEDPSVGQQLRDRQSTPFKKGRFTWYPVKGGGKVRKCDNGGCGLYLKYSEERKTYEHWKYDQSTTLGGYVQDICDYYQGGN